MSVLAQKLKETTFAILCLTRDNASSPWLHFEAAEAVFGPQEAAGPTEGAPGTREGLQILKPVNTRPIWLARHAGALMAELSRGARGQAR